MVNTLNGLEKAIAEMKLQSQKTADKLEALSATLDDIIWEFRASLASQLMTFPRFNGSEVLVWLKRADQYFLLNKTPSDRRVDFAMAAIDGRAMPWKKLLVQRCPSLSWDRLVQELLKRFGETIPSDSRVTSNSPKYSSDDTIGTVHVAKNLPKIPPAPSNNTATAILPTVTAPLLPSSPHATNHHEIPAIKTSTNHPDLSTPKDNSAPLPLPVQHAFLPPVHRTLPSSTILPTPATVTAPLLSASPDILQIRSPFLALLRCLVPAAGHQSAPMVVPFSDSLFSSAGVPFSYLVMLRFLHIVGNLLWFDALDTTRKHEFEPPPDIMMCFEFN